MPDGSTVYEKKIWKQCTDDCIDDNDDDVYFYVTATEQNGFRDLEVISPIYADDGLLFVS